MMGYYDDSWGVGEWLAMSSMMLLFWGLMIGLVVWAVRNLRSSERRSAGGPDEILAERYARGEIDEDEFRFRRELLHSTSGPRR